MSNLKKLCLYCYDCIKASGKNDKFLNLKDVCMIKSDDDFFEADNKQIIDMMMKAHINKTTMSIYSGQLFFENEKYYTPILYAESELMRIDDKIQVIKKEDYQVNINLIACLLDNDADIIEKVINDLYSLDNIEKLDFKKILGGLIDLNGVNIKEQKAVILSETPDNTAGLLNELKKIIKNT